MTPADVLKEAREIKAKREPLAATYDPFFDEKVQQRYEYYRRMFPVNISKQLNHEIMAAARRNVLEEQRRRAEQEAAEAKKVNRVGYWVGQVFVWGSIVLVFAVSAYAITHAGAFRAIYTNVVGP